MLGLRYAGGGNGDGWMSGEPERADRGADPGEQRFGRFVDLGHGDVCAGAYAFSCGADQERGVSPVKMQAVQDKGQPYFRAAAAFRFFEQQCPDARESGFPSDFCGDLGEPVFYHKRRAGGNA